MAQHRGKRTDKHCPRDEHKNQRDKNFKEVNSVLSTSLDRFCVRSLARLRATGSLLSFLRLDCIWKTSQTENSSPVIVRLRHPYFIGHQTSATTVAIVQFLPLHILISPVWCVYCRKDFNYIHYTVEPWEPWPPSAEWTRTMLQQSSVGVREFNPFATVVRKLLRSSDQWISCADLSTNGNYAIRVDGKRGKIIWKAYMIPPMSCVNWPRALIGCMGRGCKGLLFRTLGCSTNASRTLAIDMAYSWVSPNPAGIHLELQDY
jgi:hypothetical protein